jgi:hypothetical protein
VRELADDRLRYAGRSLHRFFDSEWSESAGGTIHLRLLEKPQKIRHFYMTLGEQLIGEIARRHLRGRFFTYGQYRRLRQVNSTEALKRLLDENGFKGVGATEDVAAVANQLEAADAPPATLVQVLCVVLGDVFLFGIPRLFGIILRRGTRQ